MAPTVELHEATDRDKVTARERWRERHRAWWTAERLTADDIEHRFADVDRELAHAIEQPVHVIWSGDAVVGTVATALFERENGVRGRLDDIWIEPSRRRHGFATEALNAIEAWLRDERNATSVFCTIDPHEPAQAALLADYHVQSQRMSLHLTTPPVLPEGLSYRPFPEAGFESWRTEQIEGYAESIAESGALSLDEARLRSVAQFGELLPLGLATPDHTFWVLESGGEQVAMIWLHHHREFRRSFVYSVEVESEHRRKGYGKAIMRVGEIVTLEAGDNVLALNVFGQNATAIALYTKLGYHVTDQSRMRTLD